MFLCMLRFFKKPQMNKENKNNSDTQQIGGYERGWGGRNG